MDITNCSNCGGILDKYGHCNYCGTTYKRPNQVDIPEDTVTDIELRFQRGKEVFILPLTGRISSLEIIPEYESYTMMNGMVCKAKLGTTVNFEFNGSVTP